MIAWTMRAGVLNVGSISAASRTPRRPLVPAPTKMTRPPLRKAAVSRSAAIAIRARSRRTAVMTFRSSTVMRSMISSVDALSMARLAGLMASVGRSFHFDDVAMGGVRLTSASVAMYNFRLF